MDIRPLPLRRDALTAAALALLLAFWAVRDWLSLSMLRLPDTDGGMRL